MHAFRSAVLESDEREELNGSLGIVGLEQEDGHDEERREHCGEKTCLLIVSRAQRLEVHTHKHEEGINVVRVVRNHVFIMTEDAFLYKLPALEGDTALYRSAIVVR